MNYIIEAKSAYYEYTNVKALQDVSFTISPNEITALVGPNGSGKTTLMRSVAALSSLQSGNIFIDGLDTIDYPREIHQKIGYLSDFFGLYDELTVAQHLEYAARSKNIASSEIEEISKNTLELLSIHDLNKRKVGELSRGQKQRVGIGMAIVHKPRLLILDEPASGLDPEARYKLSELLLYLQNKGMSILVSSHILAELEDYCTELLILKDGKLVEHTKLKNTNIESKKTKIRIKFLGNINKEVFDFMESQKVVSEIFADKNNTLEYVFTGEEIDKINFNRQLFINGYPILELSEPQADFQKEYLKSINRI